MPLRAPTRCRHSISRFACVQKPPSRCSTASPAPACSTSAAGSVRSRRCSRLVHCASPAPTSARRTSRPFAGDTRSCRPCARTRRRCRSTTNAFDAAVLMEVLEHVEDDRAALWSSAGSSATRSPDPLRSEPRRSGPRCSSGSPSDSVHAREGPEHHFRDGYGARELIRPPRGTAASKSRRSLSVGGPAYRFAADVVSARAPRLSLRAEDSRRGHGRTWRQTEASRCCDSTESVFPALLGLARIGCDAARDARRDPAREGTRPSHRQRPRALTHDYEQHGACSLERRYPLSARALIRSPAGDVGPVELVQEPSCD